MLDKGFVIKNSVDNYLEFIDLEVNLMETLEVQSIMKLPVVQRQLGFSQQR